MKPSPIKLRDGTVIGFSPRLALQISERSEDLANIFRGQAQGGNISPASIVNAYSDAVSDIAAATDAMIQSRDDIDAALQTLQGGAAHTTSPLGATAQNLSNLAKSFEHASGEMVINKSADLIVDSIKRLKRTRTALCDHILEAEGKREASHRKFKAALALSLAKTTAPFRITLRQADELLGWGLPKSDIELGAPDYDDSLPPSHPGRLAAVLQTLARTEQAKQVLATEAAKVKKAVKAKKSAADLIREELQGVTQ